MLRQHKNRTISMRSGRTLTESPSCDGTHGLSGNRCAGQTDWLNVVVERQWFRQFNHGNINTFMYDNCAVFKRLLRSLLKH